MESFGLGDVVKYYEKYFGERITTVLLILGALAFAAFCVGMITSWLIMPVLEFLQSTRWQSTLITAAVAALGIGGGVALGLWLVAAFAAWRRVKKMGVTLDRAKTAQKRAEVVAHKSQTLLAAAVITTREAVRLSGMGDKEKSAWEAQLEEAERLITNAGINLDKLEPLD